MGDATGCFVLYGFGGRLWVLGLDVCFRGLGAYGSHEAEFKRASSAKVLRSFGVLVRDRIVDTVPIDPAKAL